jgi:hypothetical protein
MIYTIRTTADYPHYLTHYFGSTEGNTWGYDWRGEDNAQEFNSIEAQAIIDEHKEIGIDLEMAV